MEWFGNKNPQLLKAGGTLAVIVNNFMTKSTLIILLTFALVSCRKSSEISFVVESINNCVEGSNQIDVDEKAYFDEESKSLLIYVGENPNRSIKKWIIPLSELDAENVYYENIDFPYILTVMPKGLKRIKYYENDILVDSLTQFAYPIHDYCLDKEKTESLINNYRKAILKIKND
jgi:hypothetical protein